MSSVFSKSKSLTSLLILLYSGSAIASTNPFTNYNFPYAYTKPAERSFVVEKPCENFTGIWIGSCLTGDNNSKPKRMEIIQNDCTSISYINPEIAELETTLFGHVTTEVNSSPKEISTTTTTLEFDAYRTKIISTTSQNAISVPAPSGIFGFEHKITLSSTAFKVGSDLKTETSLTSLVKSNGKSELEETFETCVYKLQDNN